MSKFVMWLLIGMTLGAAFAPDTLTDGIGPAAQQLVENMCRHVPVNR
jgi:hypothetical protein